MKTPISVRCPFCGEPPRTEKTRKELFYFNCRNTECKIQPVQVVDYNTLDEAEAAWTNRTVI